MRPMDIYSEKHTKDGSPDKIASSTALLNEAQALSLPKADGKGQSHSVKTSDSDFNSSVGMGQRDKLALASIAFCSPLMLLEIGAALGLSDNMRMNREHALKNEPVIGLRQSSFDNTLKSGEKRPLSMPTDTMSGIFSSRLEPKKSRLEFKNRRDNVLYPAETVWRQPSPERSWVKASKILKRKQHLMDHIEKCRGMLELSAVSAIVAKIERLDKELKKMGC